MGNLVEIIDETDDAIGCRLRVVDVLGIGPNKLHNYWLSTCMMCERRCFNEGQLELITEADVKKRMCKSFITWLKQFTEAQYGRHTAHQLAHVIVRKAEEKFKS